MEVTRYPKTGRYGNQPQSALEQLLDQPAIDFRREQYDKLLNDLQSNILKHHKQARAEHYFLTFYSRTEALDLLKDLSPYITSAGQQLSQENESNLNVYLTYAGYRFLEIPDHVTPGESAFRMGMQQRAQLEKEQVEYDFKEENNIHAIILYAYKNKKDDKHWERIRQLKTGQGAHYKIRFTQKGVLSNPLSSRYQFKDGISNPRFFPGAFASSKEAVKATELSPLKLVLRQDHGGNHADSCGSYGVFSKFEIKEQAMDRLIEQVRAIFNDDEALALANILGRFNDGTPLTLSDKATKSPTNHFDYKELIKIKGQQAAKDDTDGSRCPFHTHIRKSNPREPGAERRRIVRRGMFYQEKSGEKGLLFISFQNSLEKQFEYMLNNWLLHKYQHINESEESAMLVKTNQDILFSRAGDRYEFSNNWNSDSVAAKKEIVISESMIEYKGGVYFFAPCISFFKKIDLYKKIKPNTERVALDQGTTGQEPTPLNPEVPEFIEGTVIELGNGESEDSRPDQEVPFIKDSELWLRTEIIS